GIGKSRLMRALRERLTDERHTWLECRGSAFHANSAFYPVIELLRQSLRFAADSSPAEQVAWIERSGDRSGIDRETVVPLLAKLLWIPLPEGYGRVEPGADAQRRRTLEALIGWVVALARLQPVVLIAEDLHWTDPSSLELLGAMISRLE